MSALGRPIYHLTLDKLLMSAGIHFFICRMGCWATRGLNELLCERSVCNRARHLVPAVRELSPPPAYCTWSKAGSSEVKVLTEGFKDGLATQVCLDWDKAPGQAFAQTSIDRLHGATSGKYVSFPNLVKDSNTQRRRAMA